MELFEPIFRAFEAGGVRYVAVGGIATVLQLMDRSCNE